MPSWFYYVALLIVALAGVYVGYERGRYTQQSFDWRWSMRRQEKLMADFSVLQAELTKLIAYVQQPRAEDPAIQVTIDSLAAQVKAENDRLTPA